MKPTSLDQISSWHSPVNAVFQTLQFNGVDLQFMVTVKDIKLALEAERDNGIQAKGSAGTKPLFPPTMFLQKQRRLSAFLFSLVL